MWNVFIHVELFCIVRSFAGLPNLSIFMKFVHADESFPCSWTFFIFAKCFHGYGTFICFSCPFIYFHAHLIFSCLWNIPFSQKLTVLMELFHAYENSQCFHSFSMLKKLFHVTVLFNAYEAFPLPLEFSVLLKLCQHYENFF